MKKITTSLMSTLVAFSLTAAPVLVLAKMTPKVAMPIKNLTAPATTTATPDYSTTTPAPETPKMEKKETKKTTLKKLVKVKKAKMAK